MPAAACSPEADEPPDDGRVDVVAPVFPLAEAARAVAGPNVRVHDLTPPGVEPHDLELSPAQVDQVEDADVVIVLPGFQPALERAARRAKGTVVKVNLLGATNPHIWLSLVRFPDVVKQIAAAIPGADPARFADEVSRLNEEFIVGTRNCERRTLVTAHAAFEEWNRYDLDPHAITATPEAEPDPRRIAELADLVRRTGTTTVFAERLSGRPAAEALARESGAKVDVLDTLESGEPGTYLQVMRDNLARLRAALGCR